VRTSRPRRRAALTSLGAGLLVVAAARLTIPLDAPPLYDGVIVQDPYRYLAPESGQAGSPSSFRATENVTGPTSPQFVGATSENPPQAQLIAPAGAFDLTPGTTSLAVSIEPVAPAATPSGDTIAGNVYRFTVRDLSGAVPALSAENHPTLILRAPQALFTATIGHRAGGAWQRLPTDTAGQPGMFSTNVSELGDFAVLAAPSQGPIGLNPVVVAVAAMVAGVSAVGLLVLLLRGQRRTPVSVSLRGPLPSKRRRRDARRRGRGRS
jgi:hypothetical protein